MPDSIYLDNQATTPTDPRVTAAMLPFFRGAEVGNPHSDHFAGRRAADAIEHARARVAELIGARPEEIIFTSGATEANNLAIQGLARSKCRRGNHIITCATEHKCVLETVAFLSRSGFAVDVLPVKSNGLIDIEKLAIAIRPDTFLVSIMFANNEIGVLQPINKVAELCRLNGIVFHSDAAQAAGKVPIDVKELGVDLMSLSAHKLYAPIGAGALYVSEESPVVPEPLFMGGGQERGLRSGTLAPHLCVGFGEACAIARAELAQDAESTATMRNLFLEIILNRCPDIRINGDRALRLPGNLSLTFPGVDADQLVGNLQPEIALSSTAACSAGILHPSHVLLALGLSELEASCTIRVGFGRFNTRPEVERAAERVAAAASRIRISEALAGAKA